MTHHSRAHRRPANPPPPRAPRPAEASTFSNSFIERAKFFFEKIFLSNRRLCSASPVPGVVRGSFVVKFFSTPYALFTQELTVRFTGPTKVYTEMQ